ncbi:ABC transporter permease [Ancylobacter amanitiformis]|uniref:Peptide/nickel transport system permease protein n=1 Tax=Ancylobacter amanitiformis TaxID=217069 RepID=A0ABU0LK90_9HYPH|nr:ABC transporter permease [Ancylobacter amanitiformis]MDQ0509126.1 peptide/nickel transport system permease protein [Ancylobacter amanitiformis]
MTNLLHRLAPLAFTLARMLAQAAGIVVIVFLLARLIPGDAVDVKGLEGDLTAAQQVELRHQLGLDRPVVEQLAGWSWRLLNGDFGASIRFGRPVSAMLATALPTTLLFTALSFSFALLLALGVAVSAVTTGHRGLRGLVDVLNVWSIALPTFCVGVVGILVFSIWLGWLPVLGSMVLPVIIIGIDSAGLIVKPLHEELREAATSAHVRTARAKGLAPSRIALRHLLPTAVPVMLALSGLVLTSLVAGTLTMEVLFGLPGVGSLLLNAIHGRDYPVIQAAILVIAIALVIINAATDLLHRLIDPRMTS